MQITRKQLIRIIREEAGALQEAPRTKLKKNGFVRSKGPRRGPSYGSGFGGGPLSEPEEDVADIGSYDAVEAGVQLERFADAVEEYAGMIPRGPGSRARGAGNLKTEFMNVADKLRELSTRWNRLMLGPDVEY